MAVGTARRNAEARENTVFIRVKSREKGKPSEFLEKEA
jgi:hypothetical protein